uniref:hypothetical protein n=1 Tax=Flavobacterium sp. TaxID=239 RepID=UPI00404B2ACC
MKTTKIYDEDMKGFTRSYHSDFVENVNPIEYYKNLEKEVNIQTIKDILFMKNPLIASTLDESFFDRMANKFLGNTFEKTENIVLHENFIKLLLTNKKSEQKKLLRGMSINYEELVAMIFKSYEYGFLYSKYVFERLPNISPEKKKPLIAHKNNDNTITKVGYTDLTDGEIKSLIEQRKVIVSHFFAKDDLWHCFFGTYNSIRGKENWKDGQSHFHYISSGFGVRKEDFILSMKKGNYLSTSIHLDYVEE